MKNFTRRSALSTLAGAGAYFALANSSPKPAQAIEVDTVVEIFENIFASLEMVSDATAAVINDKAAVFKNVLEKSEQVIAVQDSILGQIKEMRLLFRGKIAEVFAKRTRMELSAELDGLRILLADGSKPSAPGPHLLSKAQRLERLSYEIAEKHGPAGYPTFAMAVVAAYTVHKLQNTGKPVVASLMKSHASIVSGWLGDNQNGSITQLVREIGLKGSKTTNDQRLESLYGALQKTEHVLLERSEKLLAAEPTDKPAKRFIIPDGPTIKL